jgi:hypothetical protein
MNSRRFMGFFPEPRTTPTMGYTASSGKHRATLQDEALRFGSGHLQASINLVLKERGLDVPISGKPEIGAPPHDDVCGFKIHPPDPIGFMESIY